MSETNKEVIWGCRDLPLGSRPNEVRS